MNEMFTVICLIVSIAALVSASVQDIRSREVSDIHWAIVGTAGIAASVVMISDTVTLGRLMVCIGSAMILFDVLYEREWKKHHDALFYVTMALMFAVPMMTSFDDIFVRTSMTVPLCFIAFVAMYFGGIIKGGADVKCLVALAIMFPAYPELFGYPMIGVPSSVLPMFLPFAVAVLFYASLFTVIAMLPVIFRNVMRGDTEMPNMFIGHRVPADNATGHVWPMGGGEKDGKIWVIAKIPFIVPMTVAVSFTVFIGNVFFL